MAALFAAHPFQPMHVSAALGHLAKLHAMAMPPADAQRMTASALVPRLAGARLIRPADGLTPMLTMSSLHADMTQDSSESTSSKYPSAFVVVLHGAVCSSA